MKQVLHIISSPKNEASMSRVLGKKVIQSLKEKHQQANTTERYEQLLKQYPSLLQRVPKTLLASYLGVSRESLSRLSS